MNSSHVVNDMHTKEHLNHAINLEKIYSNRPNAKKILNKRTFSSPISDKKNRRIDIFQNNQQRRDALRENHCLLKRIIEIRERKVTNLSNLDSIFKKRIVQKDNIKDKKFEAPLFKEKTLTRDNSTRSDKKSIGINKLYKLKMIQKENNNLLTRIFCQKPTLSTKNILNSSDK